MQPMSYVPRFCQKKDLVKIHICGKFYQCSVCGCEVKVFQRFCITSESMKGLLFWGGGVGGGRDVGSILHQILFDLTETLTRVSLQ